MAQFFYNTKTKFACALTVFMVRLCFGFAFDYCLNRYAPSGASWVWHSLVSQLVYGSVWVAATIIIITMLENSHKEELHRAKVIGEMNHHVRNAMQVIILDSYFKDENSIGRINDALDTIDWALREVLPAKSDAPVVQTSADLERAS